MDHDVDGELLQQDPEDRYRQGRQPTRRPERVGRVDDETERHHGETCDEEQLSHVECEAHQNLAPTRRERDAVADHVGEKDRRGGRQEETAHQHDLAQGEGVGVLAEPEVDDRALSDGHGCDEEPPRDLDGPNDGRRSAECDHPGHCSPERDERYVGPDLLHCSSSRPAAATGPTTAPQRVPSPPIVRRFVGTPGLAMRYATGESFAASRNGAFRRRGVRSAHPSRRPPACE